MSKPSTPVTDMFVGILKRAAMILLTALSLLFAVFAGNVLGHDPYKVNVITTSLLMAVSLAYLSHTL